MGHLGEPTDPCCGIGNGTHRMPPSCRIRREPVLEVGSGTKRAYQHGRVDQRTVRPLSEVRRHRVCGIAHEHELLIVPSVAVDAYDLMDQQVVEVRHARQ